MQCHYEKITLFYFRSYLILTSCKTSSHACEACTLNLKKEMLKSIVNLNLKKHKNSINPQ